MIPRVIVPTNARISSKQSNGPIAVRQDLLVPRNLIPADARISEAVEASGVAGSATGTVADSRCLMVPKLLVPAGARIGAAAEPEGAGGASPIAQVNVFDEALLGNSSLGHRRSPADWLVSLGVHAAILAVVLIVPLFYTQVIDLQQFETTYLAAPPTSAGPPPPPAPAVAAPRQPLHKVFGMTAKLTMPTAVPKTVHVPSSPEEAPSDVLAGVPGVLGGVPGGVPGGVLGGILGSAGPSAPPPPPVAEASAPSEPLQVGGQVKPPRALSRPAPEYPILAKQARIQGVVEVDAVINTHGNIVQARAMSGPQVLFSAALKAVTGWKYEPTYLNGQAYPVELTVQVTFSLG
jgi:periplasmic protein TonB